MISNRDMEANKKKYLAPSSEEFRLKPETGLLGNSMLSPGGVSTTQEYDDDEI